MTSRGADLQLPFFPGLAWPASPPDELSGRGGPSSRTTSFLFGCLIVPMLGACGGDEVPLYGPPTGATCPSSSTLTYENFGKSFMEAHCTRCHSSTLLGTARRGAPTFHDFDTVAGIRPIADHIELTTAAGPDGTNTSMPPDGTAPTVEERTLLGEWIACGAP